LPEGHDLLASLRFKRYLKVTKGGLIRIDRGAIREAARYDGRWVIETNDDTISLEDAACGYKGLMVIERCFRSLKRTRIKMSPIHHWAPRRIEAHVKICVLALLAYSGKTVHLIRRIASTRSEDNRPRVPKLSVH
jgi:transposase